MLLNYINNYIGTTSCNYNITNKLIVVTKCLNAVMNTSWNKVWKNTIIYRLNLSNVKDVMENFVKY